MDLNTESKFKEAIQPIIKETYASGYNDAIDAVVRTYTNILNQLPEEALKVLPAKVVYEDFIANIPKLKLDLTK